jgi:hypothetical protein
MITAGGGNAAGIFPEMYALINVAMVNGDVWGGICMELMDLPLINLLFVNSSLKHSSKNARKLAELTSEFAKLPIDTAAYIETINNNAAADRGVRVKKMEKRGLQTSLVVACLEVLHIMHKNNWVHGDSHLGNFVLDIKKWRVYAIDMERSFSSSDAVQQFLDIQELFGHASGLLVSFPSGDGWDMLDVWGVAAKLHPLLRPTSSKKHRLSETSVFHMLPVCICFVSDDLEDRMQGCVCCGSKKNVQAAKYFQTHGYDHIQNFSSLSLKGVKTYVSAAREVTIKECSQMEKSLTLCKKDLTNYIALNSSSQFNTTTLSLDMDEMCDFQMWMRKVLYLGSLLEYWGFQREKVISYLRVRGYPLVANELLHFKTKK